MKIKVAAAALCLAWVEVAGAQSCPPATRPSNPAPTSRTSPDRIVGDFRVNEERTKTVRLESDKSYWISAAGCPRMGNIRVEVAGPSGDSGRANEGYSPSFCFKPEKSGAYTVKVKALSLTGSNSWGSIDAGLSESNCQE